MESPELKALVDDILNKYLNYITSDNLKEFIYTLVSSSYNKGLEAGEINFNRNFVPNYETVSFIQKYAFDNVKQLTEETKDNLRKEMAQGLMNSESIAQLKLRIMDVMDTTIKRAEMITRTESVRSFNMGHFQAAKESGLKVQKQWSAQPEHNDNNPCKICEALDGQVVELDGKFTAINGEQYLLPPIHPHCKCRVLYIQKNII